MIRLVWTWLLVVLAASPFTAPFSTCDVSALLGARQSRAVLSVALTPSCLSAACGTDETGSISLVVARVVLSRDTVLGVSRWPVPPTGDVPVPALLASVQDPGALEDPPLHSDVLRL